MSSWDLVAKYINSAEHVLRTMTITRASSCLDVDKVGEVVEWARAYLEDAKHYRKDERFEVSLASVAYSEGLLDALRLLGAVDFEWPGNKKIAEVKAQKPISESGCGSEQHQQ